jgi:hypothetical protein
MNSPVFVGCLQLRVHPVIKVSKRCEPSFNHNRFAQFTLDFLRALFYAIFQKFNKVRGVLRGAVFGAIFAEENLEVSIECIAVRTDHLSIGQYVLLLISL